MEGKSPGSWGWCHGQTLKEIGDYLGTRQKGREEGCRSLKGLAGGSEGSMTVKGDCLLRRGIWLWSGRELWQLVSKFGDLESLDIKSRRYKIFIAFPTYCGNVAEEFTLLTFLFAVYAKGCLTAKLGLNMLHKIHLFQKKEYSHSWLSTQYPLPLPFLGRTPTLCWWPAPTPSPCQSRKHISAPAGDGKEVGWFWLV